MTKEEMLKKHYVTVAEIQEYLQISKGAAYELCHRREFPICRVGTMIRIPTPEFFEWVERRTRVKKEVPRNTGFKPVKWQPGAEREPLPEGPLTYVR